MCGALVNFGIRVFDSDALVGYFALESGACRSRCGSPRRLISAPAHLCPSVYSRATRGTAVWANNLSAVTLRRAGAEMSRRLRATSLTCTALQSELEVPNQRVRVKNLYPKIYQCLTHRHSHKSLAAINVSPHLSFNHADHRYPQFLFFHPWPLWLLVLPSLSHTPQSSPLRLGSID